MTGPVGTTGQAASQDQPTIVPTKAMLLIERALSPSDAEVQLAVVGNELLVHSQRATISARLLEGRFPDWRKVFPEQTGGLKLELAVGPTHAAVRQAAIVTSEESRGVDFSFGGGTLRLSSQAADVGTSKVEMPIGYDGEEIIVTFDPRFVADFLKVLDPASQVTLKLIDANSAAVFTADENYTYVVMPLSREGRQ